MVLSNLSPLVIGGVGGSGTRLIAQIFQESGYFMGNDLNESNDNLLFTLIFKRESILIETDEEIERLSNIFVKIMTQESKLSAKETARLIELSSADRTLHQSDWLKERLNYLNFTAGNNKLWGWKEPNSHIVIEKLLHLHKDLKFIYVFRNGMDMAYSSNQNQLKLWGSIFLNQKDIEINPRNSLKYWCLAHKRILKLQKKYPTNITLLDFDKLCLEPLKTLAELDKIFNINSVALESLVQAPSSIGRYRSFPLENFDKEDLDFVASVYNA